MSTPSDILAWIRRSFPQVRIHDHGEVQFACPFCGHPSFYFNFVQGIGFCHRDACHRTPRTADLIQLIGSGPELGEGGLLPLRQDEKPKEEPIVVLPPSDLLVYPGEDGRLVTNHPDAVIGVMGRGLPLAAICGWGLTYDGTRVFIPVHDIDGKLVQYVGRLRWWGDPPRGRRYEYARGVNIGRFLLGWSEASLWEDALLLVENSFNAIAYRCAGLPASTNFGSWLSDMQIDSILRTKLRRVVLMWDAGAGKNAEKGIRKLRAGGISAAHCVISGQPDDHPLNFVKTAYNATLEAIDKGETVIDLSNA